MPAPKDLVAIASDHAGFQLKEVIKAELTALGHEVLDLGPQSGESVDYPDYGEKMARTIRDGRVERGVIICGSGIGISIAANRFPEVRPALCHDNIQRPFPFSTPGSSGGEAPCLQRTNR